MNKTFFNHFIAWLILLHGLNAMVCWFIELIFTPPAWVYLASFIAIVIVCVVILFKYSVRIDIDINNTKIVDFNSRGNHR